MSRATGKMNPATTQLNEEKHVEGLQPSSLNGEEIAGQLLVCIGAQEFAPATALLRPLWRSWYLLAFEYISGCGASNLVA